MSGYRNSQATVIAPTGTIAFMMDCDTWDQAGYRAGQVQEAGWRRDAEDRQSDRAARVKASGLRFPEVQEIVRNTIDEHEIIEGAPHLKPTITWRCSIARLPPRSGTRSIHYLGHLKMMGAVQPFISGAISKTINMPAAASVDEVEEAYHQPAWQLELEGGRDLSRRLPAHPAA